MKLKLIPLLLLFSPTLLPACSCIYGLTFCENITPETRVATVRIIKSYFTGLWKHQIDVLVEDRPQGTIPEDTITIVTGYGTNCDPAPSGFIFGDSLIVLIPENTSHTPGGWLTFDFNAVCSATFLLVKKGNVLGWIDRKQRQQPYLQFLSNMTVCAKMTFSPERELLDRLIYLYPNPAREKVRLEIQGKFDVKSIDVFSSSGARLSGFKTVNSYLHELDTEEWPVGIYFVRISTLEHSVIRKFVKH